MAYQDEATEAAEMDINNPARRGLNKLVRVDMADPARMSVGDRSRVIIGDAARMNMNDPARLSVGNATRLSVGNAPRVVINDPARMMHYPQMTCAMERREDRVVRDRLDVVDGDDDNVRSGTSIDV